MLIEISLINDCVNLRENQEQKHSALLPKIKLTQKTPHGKDCNKLDRFRRLDFYNKERVINLIFIYSRQPANEFTSKHNNGEKSRGLSTIQRLIFTSYSNIFQRLNYDSFLQIIRKLYTRHTEKNETSYGNTL